MILPESPSRSLARHTKLVLKACEKCFTESKIIPSQIIVSETTPRLVVMDFRVPQVATVFGNSIHYALVNSFDSAAILFSGVSFDFQRVTFRMCDNNPENCWNFLKTGCTRRGCRWLHPMTSTFHISLTVEECSAVSYVPEPVYDVDLIHFEYPASFLLKAYEKGVEMEGVKLDCKAYQNQCREARKSHIIIQVEYYMGPLNFNNDVFLQKHTDVDGYVPLELLLTFNRMRRLGAPQDPAELATLLGSSRLLELAGQRVRWRDRDVLHRKFESQTTTRSSTLSSDEEIHPMMPEELNLMLDQIPPIVQSVLMSVSESPKDDSVQDKPFLARVDAD